MPAFLRFLLPVSALALIGSLVFVAATGDEDNTEATAESTDESEATSEDSDGTDDGAAMDDDAGAGGDEAANAEPEPEPDEPFDINAIPAGVSREFAPAPDAPDGPWSEETAANLETIVATLVLGSNPRAEINSIAETGDPRLIWPIADLLRFIGPGEASESLVGASQRLAPDLDVDFLSPWGSTVDHLIAWDLPVPEQQYLDFKRQLYGQIEPKWGELFTDEANIDWRLVGWGGVGIDDREFRFQRSVPLHPGPRQPSGHPGLRGRLVPR